jgi:hypothetical protein
LTLVKMRIPGEDSARVRTDRRLALTSTAIRRRTAGIRIVGPHSAL